MKIALLSFLLSALLAAASPWHAASADVRIRFSWGDANVRNVLVPVPEELQASAKDVLALDDAGIQLPASPVWIGGRLVAAAIDGTNSKAGKGNDKKLRPSASLYLLSEKHPSPKPYSGAPLHFSRLVKSLTTRPHTAAEMLRYFGNLHLVPYPQSLKSPHKARFKTAELKGFWDFGQSPEMAAVPEQKKGHDAFARSLTVSSVVLAFDKPAKIAFTADRRNVAWTMLLDARPVANWTDEGGKLPEWQDIAPGLHTLQLIAVQSINEPLPLPLLRYGAVQDAKPIALTELLPATMPQALGVETQKQQGKEAFAALAPEHAFSFAETAEHLVQFSATSADAPAETTFLDADGSTLPVVDGTLFAGGCYQPSVRIAAQGRTYTFAGRHLWRPPMDMNIAARLSSPPYQDMHQPMPLDISADMPASLPDALRSQISITVSQFLADGTPSAIGKPILLEGDSLFLDIPLVPQARRLTVTGRIGAARVFADLSLALIYPNDAHLPLRAQGRQLFTAGSQRDYATLLANDLPHQIVNSPSAAPPHIAVVDDFLLTSQAPGADALPQPPLTLLASPAPMGTSQDLVLAVTLHRLLSLHPDTACLLLTPKGFTPHEELKLTTFANACRTHGIRPVAVILPALPGLSEDTARQTALAIKSHAARSSLACLDLYTSAVLECMDTSTWFTAEGTPISTINNSARLWLFDHLRKTP